MSIQLKFWIVTFAVVCLVITGGAMTGYQDKELENSKLKNRVESLEKRVEQMELVLFSTSKLSLLRAERRLAEAEVNLNHVEQLMIKGLVNELQISQARFDVREAFQELKLAKSQNRQKELSSNLELIQIERRFKDAQDQLQYKKGLFDRGFVSKAEIDRMERNLDVLKRAVDDAKLKLDAARNLEAIKDNDENADK